MAATVTFKLAQFTQSTLEPAIAARMAAAGTAMLSTAQNLVPVDTGATKASLATRYDRAAHRLELYATTPYALWLEVGTRRMAPRPYLRPALGSAAPSWGA